MTIESRIHPERRLITHLVTGTPAVPDFAEAFDRINGFPEYDPGYSVIWNVSDADLEHLTASDIRMIAEAIKERVRERTEKYKVAFVAGNDLAYGLSHIYMVFTADTALNIQLFRTEDDALRWIESDEEE